MAEPQVEAPLESRMAWLSLVLGLVLTFNLAGWADDAPLIVVPLLVLAWAWGIGRTVGLRAWRVTWDGEFVEVRAWVGRWRFRPEDVTAVVVPAVVSTCAVIRARPVERTVLGIRWPWPWPWARALPTYVQPRWFTDVVGISPGTIRPNLVRTLLSSRTEPGDR